MIQAALHLTAAALLCFVLRAPPLVFVAGLLLSLAPDIDTPRSLVGALCPSISRRIEGRWGHRTITHSLLALGVVAAAAWLLAPQWWLALAGSYATHLLIDLLIGVTGIALLWPSGTFLSLAEWEDGGPAPRRLLLTLLPLTLLAALWDDVWPLLRPPVYAAIAVANPIATPKPSPTIARTPTARPPIALSFALPAGVGLSALSVRVGDRIAEGEVLARWSQPAPTPPPTATWPPLLPSPVAPPLHEMIAIPLGGNESAVLVAEATLNALRQAQPAERAALVAQQTRDLAQTRRDLEDARRDLELLQPIHEREQQEAQHAVDAANVALTDTQGALTLDDRADPAATLRLSQRVHEAEATLQQAIDAQDRMRTRQGVERREAEAAVEQAQAALDDLPSQQVAALNQLDADHRAALVRAEGQLAAARAAASEAASREAAQRRVAQATVEALRRQVAATATAEGYAWAERATATAQAHGVALTATRWALPSPAPDRVLSRAGGQVVAITAEQRDGVLVVTLEVMP